MENIYRILILYKNHYLKRYRSPLRCDYSTFGYFDGLSVHKIGHFEKRLVLRDRNVDLTDMWYANVLIDKDLDGCFGQQMIYALRYEGMQDIKDSEFWSPERALPYLFVVLIHLQLPHKNILEEGRRVEEYCRLVREEPGIRQNPAYKGLRMEAISYATIDNSDLLLVLKSNSYTFPSEIIRRLPYENQRIDYTYTICGIDQRYLEYKNGIEGLWRGCEILPERMAEVHFDLSVKYGRRESEHLWEQFPEKMQIQYGAVLGNADIMAKATDVDMADMIDMMRNGDVLTHISGVYQDYVNNISTTIIPCRTLRGKSKEESAGERCDDPACPDVAGEGGPRGDMAWCLRTLESVKKEMDTVMNSNQERIISYYQAILHLLNALAQLELSPFSTEIFYMMIPTFIAFYHYFRKIVQVSVKENEVIISEERYNKFNLKAVQYINSIDTLLNGIIHADQHFLEVPGYNESIIDIPMKLCFMYLSYLDSVSRLFRDEDEEEYIYYLAPALHNRIGTQQLFEQDDEGENIVQVSFAQKHLFMPRPLFVILAHEVAHYSGKNIRARKSRAVYLTKIIASIAANGILSGIGQGGENGEGDEDTFRDLLNRQYEELAQQLAKRLWGYVKSEDDKNYEMEIVQEQLTNGLIQMLLSDQDWAFEIAGRLEEEHIGGNEKVRSLKELQEKDKEKRRLAANHDDMGYNMGLMLTSDGKTSILRSLSYLATSMKECYADIMAILSLELKPEYYYEAMYISEGTDIESVGEERDSAKDDGEERHLMELNRTATVQYFVANHCESHDLRRRWSEFPEKADVTPSIRSWHKEVREYIDKMEGNTPVTDDASSENNKANTEFRFAAIYDYDIVWRYQIEYLKECYGEYQKEYHSNESKRRLRGRLRDIFRVVERKEGQDGFDVSKFLKMMEELNAGYFQRVKNKMDAIST